MWNIEDFTAYCAEKKGVTQHFPFDEDTLVFKVGGKMFALTSLSDWENNTPKANLKCPPEQALALRAEFDGITPGYHMNKAHWNTVAIHGDVPINQVKKLIDLSYQLILDSLPKKTKFAIQQDAEL
jgi:predicted DNA-binding protein (MmcQ/YjbR family)